MKNDHGSIVLRTMSTVKEDFNPGYLQGNEHHIYIYIYIYSVCISFFCSSIVSGVWNNLQTDLCSRCAASCARGEPVVKNSRASVMGILPLLVGG